eukprot:Nitzschia sp. Nitz4//scaffold69_size99277//75587//76570//NITZ4_004645-RA/size99277-processed-gene-0.26-mRNA-1//1//CDS//3329556751//4118//frame0
MMGSRCLRGLVTLSIVLVEAFTAWPLTGKPLAGIIPPIVTPLVANDKIDVAGTRRLLDHILDSPVTGIFVLGTTGEFPSLSVAARTKFIQTCCDIVGDRVPVLVGITDAAMATTLELARVAKEAGASAVVLTTPYYFPLEQSEVKRHVEEVLKQVDLPVMLYNMPGLTKNTFAVDTLKELAVHPNIVGIKDSSGDIEYYAKICQLKQIRPDWTILMGPEHLLAESIRVGGDGGVNGGANVYPRIFAGVHQAAEKGDQNRVEQLMKHVETFQDVYKVGTPGFRYVSGTKCALELHGICGGTMAEPFGSYTEDQKKQIQDILANIPNDT